MVPGRGASPRPDGSQAHLKVILETGELQTYDNVRRACRIALLARHAHGLRFGSHGGLGGSGGGHEHEHRAAEDRVEDGAWVASDTGAEGFGGPADAWEPIVGLGGHMLCNCRELAASGRPGAADELADRVRFGDDHCALGGGGRATTLVAHWAAGRE